MTEPKKKFMALKKVRDFFSKQPDECQAEYLSIVESLERDGFLVEPYGKKIDTDLFEIRIRRGRQVRVIYFYYMGDLIFGVHAFVKKSQKIPSKDLNYARVVVSSIKRGDYDE